MNYHYCFFQKHSPFVFGLSKRFYFIAIGIYSAKNNIYNKKVCYKVCYFFKSKAPFIVQLNKI